MSESKLSVWGLASTALMMGPQAAAMQLALHVLPVRQYTPFAVALTMKVVTDLIASGISKKNAKALAQQVTLPQLKKNGDLIIRDGEFPFPLGALEAISSIYDDKLSFEKLDMYLKPYPEDTLDKFYYMYVPFKYARLSREVRRSVVEALNTTNVTANESRILQKRLSAYDLLRGPRALKEFALDTKAFPVNPFGHRQWIGFYALQYKVRSALSGKATSNSGKGVKK